MKKQHPKQGKNRAITNFFMITAVTAALAAYFTVKSTWNAGTVVIMVILALIDIFYFWLWRKYFR